MSCLRDNWSPECGKYLSECGTFLLHTDELVYPSIFLASKPCPLDGLLNTSFNTRRETMSCRGVIWCECQIVFAADYTILSDKMVITGVILEGKNQSTHTETEVYLGKWVIEEHWSQAVIRTFGVTYWCFLRFAFLPFASCPDHALPSNNMIQDNIFQKEYSEQSCLSTQKTRSS